MGASEAATAARPWAARLPFYYGWLVVSAQFTAIMATAGPTTWAFGAFVEPMEEDLGWSRGTLFAGLTLRMVLGVGLMPFLSRLMDKPRWPLIVMVSSAVLSAGSLAATGLVQTVAGYYLIFGVVGGVTSAGAGGQLYQAIIPKWFIRRRGSAMALGSMGSSAGALTAPLYIGFFVDTLGWRWAWALTGIVAFALVVPVTLLVRRQPEDVGLLPDGVRDQPAGAGSAGGARPAASVTHEASFTVGEALRSPTTWLLMAATVLVSGSLQGLGASWINHYQDSGLSREAARLAVSAYGLFAIMGRVIWGYTADRVHIRSMFLFACAVTGLPLVLLVNVSGLGMALAYAATAGLTLGGFVSVQGLIWSNYYGRRNLGAIRGAFATPALYAGAAGPWWITSVHDNLGSYDVAYWIMLAGWLGAFALVWLARPLIRPAPAAEHAVAPRPLA